MHRTDVLYIPKYMFVHSDAWWIQQYRSFTTQTHIDGTIGIHTHTCLNSQPLIQSKSHEVFSDNATDFTTQAATSEAMKTCIDW